MKSNNSNLWIDDYHPKTNSHEQEVLFKIIPCMSGNFSTLERKERNNGKK